MTKLTKAALALPLLAAFVVLGGGSAQAASATEYSHPVTPAASATEYGLPLAAPDASATEYGLL
jgi:hypothetical protein